MVVGDRSGHVKVALTHSMTLPLGAAACNSRDPMVFSALTEHAAVQGRRCLSGKGVEGLQMKFDRAEFEKSEIRSVRRVQAFSFQSCSLDAESSVA